MKRIEARRNVRKARIITGLYEKDLKRNMQNPEFRAAFERERALYEVTQELRNLKKHDGLSQRELAQDLGVRQQELSRVLTGTHNVTVDTLTKVAKGLKKELLIQFR